MRCILECVLLIAAISCCRSVLGGGEVIMCWMIDASNKATLQGNGAGCLCSGYTCGCCVGMCVPKIRLNDTACVNVSYLPKEYGLSITVTIDKWTLYNETISARNPPPLCFGEDFFEEFADICVHFYDLNVTLSSVHGCAEIMARFKKHVIAKYNLGCFTLGKENLNFGFNRKKKVMKSNFTSDAIHIPKVFLLRKDKGQKLG